MNTWEYNMYEYLYLNLILLTSICTIGRATTFSTSFFLFKVKKNNHESGKSEECKNEKNVLIEIGLKYWKCDSNNEVTKPIEKASYGHSYRSILAA